MQTVCYLLNYSPLPRLSIGACSFPATLSIFACMIGNCRARQPSPMLRVNSEEVIELNPSPTLPQNSSVTAGSADYVTATFDTDISKI